MIKSHQWTFLLWIALVLFGISLANRPVEFDDAWFFEQAFFLARDGVIRSELFTGFYGWDKQIFITQKGNVWIIAWLIELLGPTPLAARLPALSYGLLLLASMTLYTRKFIGAKAIPIVITMTLLSGSFLRLSYIARPELLLASMTIFTFLALSPRPGNASHTVLLPILAGLGSGITLLFHLNGSILVAAGGLYLLWQRRWTHLGVFCIFSTLAASTFLWDVLWEGEMQELVYNFRVDPATAGTKSWAAKVSNFLELHRIFTVRGENAILTTMGLLSYAFFYRRKVTYGQDLTHFFLCFFVSFALLNNRVTSLYFGLFFPFFVLLSAHSLFVLAKSERPKCEKLWRSAFAFLSLIHVLAGFALAGHYGYKGFSTQGIIEHNKAIVSALPTKPEAVIAPNTFVFGTIGEMKVIGLNKYLMAGVDPFDEAGQLKIEYLIFEDHPVFAYYRLPPGTGDRVGDYIRIVNKPPLQIFRSIIH
jgi:hypothetical protein